MSVLLPGLTSAGGAAATAGSSAAASSTASSTVSLAGLASSLGSSVSLMSIAEGANSSGYDWTTEENATKWRGLFVAPLQKVLMQVHPQFTANEDALEYVESLLLRLLTMLTKPAPVTVADVEKRVSATFPKPMDEWALNDAQKALDRGKKKSMLVFPLDKVHSLLKEVLHNNRLDDQVSLYLVAVLEYIAEDILKLAGNYVKYFRHQVITCQDIKVSMYADKVLMDMFDQDDVLIYNEEDSAPTKQEQTYEEVVKDLIMDEKQYLRDLQMITKVFRDTIQKHKIASQRELEAIFSNVTDVTEVTMTLISSLEDTFEMTEEGNVHAIGSCFEELAEAEEFEVYEKYARDILSPESRRTLDELLSRPEVSEILQFSGHGIKEAFKFYLPKLLLGPVYHCFHYFKYIELLMKLTQAKEDADSLTQVKAMITPLQTKLQNMVQQAGPSAKRKPGDIFHRSGRNKISRQQSLQKLSQLQQSIVNWEGQDIAANSSEIICEGKLQVLNKPRYVFLCDGMVIICKQTPNKRGSVVQPEYRFLKRYLIRRVNVNDINDAKDVSDETKHSFALVPRDQSQSKITFKSESAEEKNSWMAALVMLNTKSILERQLDSILSNEEKKHPLRLPPSDRYQFAESNSPQNIVFEDREKTSGVPLIKGATLVKLVERLTYHVYADPMFMKTFLTTYRSFCTSNELLNLLTERFNIPDPEFSSDSESDSEVVDKTSKMRIAQDMKRFRKEYSQPVQFRVLNVLKHWVDQHFYDFDQDEELLAKLKSFLNNISGKSMKKWVDCIIKIVKRRRSNEEGSKGIIFDTKPPEIEVFIVNAEENWPALLTYHPIEIARQLTLLEFEYYRAVKPSELVDQAWTREDKDKRSPNLLKMVRHTTNYTRYLEKLIVETDNIEERTCIILRTLEIMMVLQEHNNFNGVLAITSAMNSSAVHRLVQRLSKDKIPNHLLKALEEASSYIQDHFKIYWEKLRSINPPCVPFFGQYQTNILFLEEGNPDFLHNTNLINFTKRRKVAEIISEIQQYQNQPYNLKEYPELKNFLETLDPFAGWSEKEITDYLWAKSIEIEPRSSDTSQRKRSDGERRWKGLDLRSPGIKPRGMHRKHHPNPLPKIRGHDTESPMTSPNLKSSPLSGPSTPLPPTSATSPNDEPIKALVILPQPHHNNAMPPPPLPPKPVLLRQSSPPPPLPPRRDQPPPLPRHTPTKSPLESRSPLMDPVVPRRNSSLDHHVSQTPPAVVPRRHSAMTNGPQASRYPPPAPLCLRTGSEGASPSSSPLWANTSSSTATTNSRDPHSPSSWPVNTSSSRGGPPSSAGLGRQQHSMDLNNTHGPLMSAGSTTNHFSFNTVMESMPPPGPPPRPPPHSSSSNSSGGAFNWDLANSSSSHR